MEPFVFTTANIQASENPVSHYLEVVLKNEQALEVPLVFRKPTLTDLCVTITRLFRFEAPPKHHIFVLDRFAKHCLIASSGAKKALHHINVLNLEVICLALWYFSLDLKQVRHVPIQDERLMLLLMLEKLSEFLPEIFLKADFLLQESRQFSTLHGHYYKGELTAARALEVLQNLNCRTDFLQDLPANAWQTGYVLCRQLSTILPIHQLLAQCSPELLDRFPEVNRLVGLSSMVEPCATSTTGVPVSLPILEAIQSFQNKLFSSRNTCSPFLKDGTEVLMRPVRQILLVEGETEKLLLPLHASLLGYSFNQLGILLCPVGGKSNMKTCYQNYANGFSGSIYALLDQDATDIVNDLTVSKRSSDYIMSLQVGEFEDLYHLDIIQQVINTVFQPYPVVHLKDLEEIQAEYETVGIVQLLKAVWQHLKLGSFDKVVFARHYGEVLQKNSMTSGGNETLWITSSMETLIKHMLSFYPE